MFDPYHKWLGIPPGQRPPTHYQLLAILSDEYDPEVIHAANLRQSAYVRTMQTGPHAADAARVLNQIAAAAICLGDPKKRADYDALLAAGGNPGGVGATSVDRKSPPTATEPRPGLTNRG